MPKRIPDVASLRIAFRAYLKKLERVGYSIEGIADCVDAFVERDGDGVYDATLQRFVNLLVPRSRIRDRIHSLSYRTKKPYHLADKLRRKALDPDPAHCRNITRVELFDPTKGGLSDLGGVRILHLYKYEWRLIDEFLRSTSVTCDFALVESIAYCGSQAERATFDDLGIFNTVEMSPRGYTSLHYIYRATFDEYQDIFIECQVRTLFEEGWGEIDHQRQYPHGASDVIATQLQLLNRAAAIADHVASSFERLDALPVFVPWEAELAYEGAAEKVFVISHDLAWAARYKGKLIEHLQDSDTAYRYLIPSLPSDNILQRNRTTLEDALHAAGLSARCIITAVAPQHFAGPFFSDVLLLKNTYDWKTDTETSLAVVGTPVPHRGEVAETSQLDVLISQEMHVAKLERFVGLLMEESAT